MKGADMSQSKDPAFKLFGRKIPVPEAQIPARSQSKDSCSEVTKEENEGLNDENSEEQDKYSDFGECKGENQASIEVNEAQVASKPKQDQAEASSTDQEKFKKPDKVVPCPRCNSLETKFCYFNNYNVNQPRHFCKNCQRYWTAGGTMRNVPIGAGRRKNKHLASQYRQILLSSDGMPITRMENPDSSNHTLISSVESASASTLRPSTGSSVVLKFGPEAPLCESMENVLNLGDQKKYAEMSPLSCRNNGEEPSSCASSLSASSVRGNDLPEIMMQKEQIPGSSNDPSVPHPMHCYPVPPLVFPWNPGWNNAASVAAAQYSSGQACIPNSNSSSQVQWCPTPMLAVPSFCPPSIPVQFVPASYWGCMPLWAPGTGSASNGCLSPSSSNTSCCSGNGSPTLGKHSRDSNFTDELKAENCILVPKTLRIDDPSVASKSPLWSALGIKPDQKDPISKGAIYKTFETKADGKGDLQSAHILEANPAALSRSHEFRESS